MKYSEREKKIFRQGLFAGLRQKSNIKKETVRQYGSTKVNGEYYDTNLKKPKKFTKEELAWIDANYGHDSKGNRIRSKDQSVEAYVNHMRFKYGSEK